MVFVGLARAFIRSIVVALKDIDERIFWRGGRSTQIKLTGAKRFIHYIYDF